MRMLRLIVLCAGVLASGFATAQPGVAELPVITLSEADIRQYIKGIKALKELGLKYEALDLDSDAARMAAGMSVSREVADALKKHGLDQARMQQVGHSIVLALAGSEINIAEVRQQKAQYEAMLKQMAGQMSADQIAQMRAAFEASMGSMERLLDQPQANIDLVKKFRPQLEAAHR